MTLDFKASGGTLEGLSRSSGSGSYVPSLYLDLSDCEATLEGIRQLLEDRNCAFAPLTFGNGISLICDGERNEIVRTVALAIRAAFENAVTP
jgi:hypothetical protein